MTTENQHTSQADVYVPKFDLSPQAAKTLLAQVVAFLLPNNAAKLAKSAYVTLDNASKNSAEVQATFVDSNKLEYVTGIRQTDAESCRRALVSAALLSVGRGQQMTASDKVEAAKELLDAETQADW